MGWTVGVLVGLVVVNVGLTVWWWRMLRKAQAAVRQSFAVLDQARAVLECVRALEPAVERHEP